MTKGLRCPNCDTTINKRVVLDYLLNKKTPFLRCNNAFCNVRWKRSSLEAHKAEFLGEDELKTVVKVPVPKPVEKVVAKKTPKKALSRAKRQAMFKGETWLDRIRRVACQTSGAEGVVSIDDLRVWADSNHMQPASPSAWGSVFQSDQWKKVRQKRSTYVKSRSRKISVWALKAPRKAAVGV